MKYEELANFIENRMRLSHIYQPVMLMALLRNGGVCHERKIAEAILDYDESQIEYYIKITNNMVGRVLRNHKCVNRDRKKKIYNLIGFEKLSFKEVKHLIKLCQQKLDSFLEARGEKIFKHRRKSTGYISGTLKYEVLKRAKFHCELCGIPADEKALEVDHIIPRNKGGSDDISNLQSLCYTCNSMKQDRDDTDFRKIRTSYDHRETGCPFCKISKSRVLNENELAYIIQDGFPVTELHRLIIPKRHISDYFDLGQSEINACNQLIIKGKEEIKAFDSSVSGFNIGVNNGQSAGQTIFHCHIHLIPRRDGDIEDPKGGVRHVIPGKGYY